MANAHNLVPLTSEKARIIGTKGGQVSSDRKKYARLVTQSSKAMCKNCKAICDFKKGNIKKSKTHRCIAPEARAKAIWFNMAVMSEELLDKLDAHALFKMAKLSKTIHDFKILHDSILNKKRLDYPKVKQIQIDERRVTLNFQDLKQLYDEVHKGKVIDIEAKDAD